METETDNGSRILETIVELAALGTSGICACAIAACGFAVWKLRRNASEHLHKTLRHYMSICAVIALISGTSGVLNAWFNARKINSANQQAAQNLKVADSLRKEVSQLEGVATAAFAAGNRLPTDAEFTEALSHEFGIPADSSELHQVIQRASVLMDEKDDKRNLTIKSKTK